MLSMELRVGAEPQIEVYRYRSGVVFSVSAAALVLQAFLPVYFHWAAALELPLLVTLYFGLSRRNPSSGLLLGMAIGVVQDSLSHNPIGLYGIAKTLVGFVASSVGSRIDVEHPISRFLLTFLFFHFHHAAFALTKRLLLGQPESYITLSLLLASVVNAALAVALFALLDLLRRRS